MITQRVNQDEFRNAFVDMNREDNFTVEARYALFDYLETLSIDTGEDIEFDVIGICCEYTEYENFEAVKKAYSSINKFENLEEHTTVILIPETERMIIQNF